MGRREIMKKKGVGNGEQGPVTCEGERESEGDEWVWMMERWRVGRGEAGVGWGREGQESGWCLCLSITTNVQI